MITKRTYYLEVVEKNGDEPYIIQSKDFSTQEECMRLYDDMFYFIDERYKVYLMAMNWLNNEEYEVEQVKEIKNDI